MDREAIETSDLKLRQKVVELRSNLSHRQQTYERKRKTRLGLKLGVPLMLVAAVGYYVTGRIAFTEHRPPSVLHEKRQTLADTSRDPWPLPMPLPSFVSPELPTSDLPAPEPLPSIEVQAMGTVETPPPADTPVLIDTPPVLADLPEAIAGTRREIPATVVVTAAEPEPSSSAVPLAAQTRVAQSLTCLKVEDRQCIGARSVFALHDHPRPHVWMDVRSQALPDVLKHVYYHNGRKYSEVALAIKYPRMRTWSRITLHSPVQVGDWQVAITTEDGTVLTQLAFRVTP